MLHVCGFFASLFFFCGNYIFRLLSHLTMVVNKKRMSHLYQCGLWIKKADECESCCYARTLGCSSSLIWILAKLGKVFNSSSDDTADFYRLDSSALTFLRMKLSCRVVLASFKFSSSLLNARDILRSSWSIAEDFFHKNCKFWVLLNVLWEVWWDFILLLRGTEVIRNLHEFKRFPNPNP